MIFYLHWSAKRSISHFFFVLMSFPQLLFAAGGSLSRCHFIESHSYQLQVAPPKVKQKSRQPFLPSCCPAVTLDKVYSPLFVISDQLSRKCPWKPHHAAALFLLTLRCDHFNGPSEPGGSQLDVICLLVPELQLFHHVCTGYVLAITVFFEGGPLAWFLKRSHLAHPASL